MPKSIYADLPAGEALAKYATDPTSANRRAFAVAFAASQVEQLRREVTEALAQLAEWEEHLATVSSQ